MKYVVFVFSVITLFSMHCYAAVGINGVFGSCVGSTSRLVDTSHAGGTWSSSNVSIATVNSSTGNVYGVSSGTCFIYYNAGSYWDSVAFTVSARPSSITGVPALFCVGSVDTLTCSPSGGRWAVSSYAASISSTTGVITGRSPGVAYIEYWMGIGCSSDTALTVNGPRDTLFGASWVCVGATTTYRMSSSTGGAWSVSNPSIATISTTGTLTGLSAGTVTVSCSITTSCGTIVVSTTLVAVISSIAAPSLSGPTSIPVGYTSSVIASRLGGTWTSSNPAVASIDATTGSVTGVSAGSVTLTYSLTTCSSTTLSFHSLTVTPFTGISGYIHLAFGRRYDSIKVWLISLNRSSGMLQAVDSTMISSAGWDSAYYQFGSAVTDTYLVKAHVIDTNTVSTHIPTYHDTSYYWFNALPIIHTSGIADIRKDIHMLYGSGFSGIGFIGGSISSGAGKGTADGVPSAGVRVLLINELSNGIVATTVTNRFGNYSFSRLPVGQTYTVFPEVMSYITTPMTGIGLTSSSSSVTAASFLQGTTTKTIKPMGVGIEQINHAITSMEFFPNPAIYKLNVQWTGNCQEKARLILSDLAGVILVSSDFVLSEVNGIKSIDVSNLVSGCYILRIRSANFSYVTKVQIAH